MKSCSLCGASVRSDGFVVDEDREPICMDCSKQMVPVVCGDCGVTFYVDKYLLENVERFETRVCTDCLTERGLSVCSECGELVQCDRWFSCGSCDSTYDSVYDYGYNPPLIARWVDRNKIKTKSMNKLTKIESRKLLMGFELEVDFTDRTKTDKQNGKYQKRRLCNLISDVLDASENNNRFFMTPDASLRCGIEIKTHPCTLEYYLLEDHSPVFDICNLCKKHGAMTLGNCGLHIHINNRYFGCSDRTVDMCRLKFIHMVNKFWEGCFVPLSGREHFDFCEKNEEFDVSPATINSYSWDDEKEAREIAINLSNEDTTEIRFWSSTIEPDVLLGKLDITNTLAILSKKMKINEINEICWEGIVEETGHFGKRYISSILGAN